jgi:hypothetical protein
MKNNRIELADVVRRFKDDYVGRFGHRMMPSHKKALADIAACMTAQMGGHQYQCRDGSRSGLSRLPQSRCPATDVRSDCSARRRNSAVRLLPHRRHGPGRYALFLSDQKFMYSRSQTVAGSGRRPTRDRKYLRATPGIL